MHTKSDYVKPRKTEIFKRYALFFFSVVLQGCSIAFITYANIGTTPISSTNFVLSLHTPYALGDTSFILNILLIFLQLMLTLMGEEKLKDHYVKLIIQIPVCVVSSFMIDLSTDLLTMVLPENVTYALSWGLVIFGTFLLALAVSLSVTANIAMAPGEYFIKLFHPLVHKTFSFVKTFFDIFLVSTAVLLSLFLTHFGAVEGVREGILYAALLTGPTVHLLLPLCAKLKPLLNGTSFEGVEDNKNVKEDVKAETAEVSKETENR